MAAGKTKWIPFKVIHTELDSTRALSWVHYNSNSNGILTPKGIIEMMRSAAVLSDPPFWQNILRAFSRHRTNDTSAIVGLANDRHTNTSIPRNTCTWIMASHKYHSNRDPRHKSVVKSYLVFVNRPDKSSRFRLKRRASTTIPNIAGMNCLVGGKLPSYSCPERWGVRSIVKCIFIATCPKNWVRCAKRWRKYITDAAINTSHVYS